MEPKTITNITQEAEAAAVARIIEKHVEPRLLDVKSTDGRSSSVLVLPTGLQPHAVEKFLEHLKKAPDRREGTAKLAELDSLIEHANRFKDSDSALWAEPSESAPKLTAVLDYHRHGADGAPRFGRHRGVYAFPLSDEWHAWVEKNAQQMQQSAFAEFLEDRIQDIADPEGAFANAKAFAEQLGISGFASPSRLLALSRGLSVHVDDRVTNKVDLSSGEATIHFETSHTDDEGAPLNVPRAFLIRLPVFRAGAAYQLAVRLRYRVSGGRVMWSYEIHGVKRALDDAFREACERAKEGTGLPLFFGQPE